MDIVWGRAARPERVRADAAGATGRRILPATAFLEMAVAAHTATTGQALVSLTDAAGDFLSYSVDVQSLTLTNGTADLQ